MTDPLIDDVKALLDKEKGDERILKQIFRACENNEVISNYERNYVKKLTEKYLGKIPHDEEKQHNGEKSIIPNVAYSKTLLNQNIESPTSKPLRNNKSGSKNKKTLLGISGIIFAIFIIISVSFTGVFSGNPNDSEMIPTDSSTSLSLKTDLSMYQKGDVISISGTSNIPGKVIISIENQSGQLIWSEQISVKSNGHFSTLAIAGGTGWDKSGTFTIKVNNNLETKTQTFSFKA